MEYSKTLPCAFVVMLVLSIVMSSNVIQGVDGSCTVENKSGKKVIIEPVEVSIKIEVDVGVSVKVPPSQQHCVLKNADSGHELGPVTLPDGALVVIVNGTIDATVDVYVATIVLGLLQLGVNICVSL